MNRVILAGDRMAETLANEVISSDFDGSERAPMRTAEARITLGVVAARQGDVDQATAYGEQALSGGRKSLPSLVMVSRDLTKIVKDRYSNYPVAKSYLDHLQALIQTSNLRKRPMNRRA